MVAQACDLIVQKVETGRSLGGSQANLECVFVSMHTHGRAEGQMVVIFGNSINVQQNQGLETEN